MFKTNKIIKLIKKILRARELRKKLDAFDITFEEIVEYAFLTKSDMFIYH